METQVQQEESWLDSLQVGSYVIRANEDPALNGAKLSTLTYKIGWEFSDLGNQYNLIAMSDGWVTKGYYKRNEDKNTTTFYRFDSLSTLRNYLSSKEYRKPTKEELIAVVTYNWNR